MKELSKIVLTCLISTTFVISPASANVSLQGMGVANMNLQDITLEYMYVYGMELYNRGDHGEAAKVFARILEINPYDEEIEDYLRESSPNHPTLKNIKEIRSKRLKTAKKDSKSPTIDANTIKKSKNLSTKESIKKISKPVEKHVEKSVDNVNKSTLSAMKGEADRYNQEIDYLENDIARLKGKINERSGDNTRVDTLKAEIKESEGQIAKLNAMLKDQDGLIAEYKEKAAVAEEKIVARDKEYQQKIHTQSTLVTQHQESLSHFKTRYTDTQHEVAKLKNELIQKDSDISLLKLQLMQTKENLELVNAKPIAVQNVLPPVSSTTHTSRIEIHGDQTVATNINHYEKLFTAKDQMIAMLKDELALLRNEIESIERHNAIVINNAYTTRYTSPTISKAMNYVPSTYSDMDSRAQQQVAEARLDLMEERGRVQYKEQELAQLKERFLDVQHKLNLVKQSVDTRNTDINSIQHELKQLTQ